MEGDFEKFLDELTDSGIELENNGDEQAAFELYKKGLEMASRLRKQMETMILGLV